jgi:hypothetical protein
MVVVHSESDRCLLSSVDRLEGELMSELENGRLVRLLVKFGFINERPEYMTIRTYALPSNTAAGLHAMLAGPRLEIAMCSSSFATTFSTRLTRTGIR